MEINLQEFCIVALIGTSGSGKTAFAKTHFPAHDIVSQAQFQEITGDDGSDPALHAETLALMYRAIEIRLQHRRACVVDAELLSPADRAELRRLSRKHHVRLSAVVMDTPVEVAIARNAAQSGRPDGAVIHMQRALMNQTVHALKEEGLRPCYLVKPEDAVTVRRYPAASDRRAETGPFDLIGDVHGCLGELRQLLDQLGYTIENKAGHYEVRHPRGRRLIFVGDLCDRGPDSPGVLRLVMDAVADGVAFCVPGNHDDKLMRKLKGNQVQLKHGLEVTMQQLEGQPTTFLEEIKDFIDGLSSHLEFDEGRLVVAHAGIKEGMHGRASGEIHSFCLYGETTGETDEFGLPVRHNWAASYTGKALVVYGHTPIPEPSWENNTVNIDTGCVFGGALTALRYPERMLVTVPAAREWSKPTRPMHWTKNKSSSAVQDFSISMDFVSPQVLVSSSDGYHINLSDQAFQSTASHLGSRCVHPRWLVYVPAYVSPPTVSPQPSVLEHPGQAIEYYRKKGVGELVAKPTNLGRPAVMVICKDEAAATRQFGLRGQGIGAIYDRTGRPLHDAATTQALLRDIAQRLTAADFWEMLATDWLAVELEVAQPTTYLAHHAVVAAVAGHALAATTEKLKAAQLRGLTMEPLLTQMQQRTDSISAYAAAAAQLESMAQPQWQLVQLLGSQNQRWLEVSAQQQAAALHSMAAALGTSWVVPEWKYANLDSENSLRALTQWWEERAAAGQGGLNIYPLVIKSDQREEMMQPAIKVRTTAELRLLFGPEFDAPEAMEAARVRNLRKLRELTVRQYSLSKEAMARLVAGRSYDEVLQCSFTSLGLMQELEDPRL